MPRMDQAAPKNQLAKLLLIGEGKCGKTDLAGMAGADGFNVLYLDGDVGAQTIAGLPTQAKQNIYLLNVSDRYTDSGGIETFFAQFFKAWTTKKHIVWNDSHQRPYSVIADGQVNETDEFWTLRPARMDHNTVLAIDSWSSLSQSCMQWAANEYGVDLGEVGDDRKDMRKVYQAAGEKLTQFLLAIQNAPCHVIVLAHPQEFVKTKKPEGKTIRGMAEGDLKVLWTKMVPKSSSNNHALSMAKYFTDVAWLEPTLTSRFIDFRVDNEKISGGHFNAKLEIGDRDKKTTGFTFAELVRKIGGTIPTEPQAIDSWLTIQTGYEQVGAKKVVLEVKPGVKVQTAAVTQNPPPNKAPAKGMLNLGALKSTVPAQP